MNCDACRRQASARPDSISHSNDVALSRGRFAAWSRALSSPSTSAASCEAESHMTLSLIGGQARCCRSRSYSATREMLVEAPVDRR